MERTKYMQDIMNATYPEIAIEAIRRGFDGAWERLIAHRLHVDFKKGVSDAEVILDYVGGAEEEDRLEAAKYILKSKIPEYDNNKQ